jgi:hypothetical protein
MPQVKHITPESMVTISARLNAVADSLEKDRHPGMDDKDLILLLREADEIIKVAVDVSSTLMARLLAQSFGLDDLLKPKTPPSDEIPGGFVEMTKNDYLGYCRKRTEGFPNKEGSELAVRAIRTANKAVGVTKVAEIDDDMGLVKHIQAAESALPGWVAGYIAHKRPDLVGG